tara:strand:- start:665 stop:1303 length:639 start_codon:yes stop_codon:yes gene_type:complete
MFKKTNIILEACVETLSEAENAVKFGANRIELCSHLDLDGLTPNKKTIIDVLERISVPVKIMIRPREGNFIYDEKEVKHMESSILFCKNNGVSNIVLGVLNKFNAIDSRLMSRLSEISKPMDITFHKAIDHTDDMEKQLEVLCSLGTVKSVLTAGGRGSLLENRDSAKMLLDRFSSKINLILAGSITKCNLKMIHNEFQATEYHGRKIVGDL